MCASSDTAHAWHRWPTEPHTHPMAVPAPVGSQRCALTRGVVCMCVHSGHVCVHTHMNSGHWGAHTCVHSAWGLTGSECGWAVLVWAGVCCAQAPADGALPPCHLVGTQICSLRKDIGGFMRGHLPLCQAEPPTIARGEYSHGDTCLCQRFLGEGSASAPWWHWRRGLCCREAGTGQRSCRVCV